MLSGTKTVGNRTARLLRNRFSEAGVSVEAARSADAGVNVRAARLLRDGGSSSDV